jgi:hypothetical protein
MKLFPLEHLAPGRNLLQISPQPIFPLKPLTVLEPADKIARPLAGFRTLCDVLERTPMPALCESVVEPVVLHGVYLPVERLVADSRRSGHSYFQALQKLKADWHQIAERDVPVASLKPLWRAIQVSVEGLKSQDLKFRLRIRVGPQREEVVEVSCRYERGHVRERLQEAIRYLLMHPKLDHLVYDAYGLESGLVPKRNRPQGFLPAQGFVSLHTLLVPAPMNRPGRALLDVVDHFLDRNRTAAGGVPAEDPVRHHFGVDKARVGHDETGYTLAVPADGVANNFRFYHRREVEPKGRDFTWLLGELDKRITIPRELFQSCSVCGAHWGACQHIENNPVCVDNEAMRLLYEKLEMPVPVYPPAWADFWYACKDIYQKIPS